MLIILGDDGVIDRVCKYKELSKKEIENIFYEGPSGSNQNLLSWFSGSSSSPSASVSKGGSRPNNKRNSGSKDSEKEDKDESKLMEKEDRQIGFVPLSVYKWFVRTGGIHYMIGMGIVQFLSRALKVSSSFYLSYWGAVNADAEMAGSPLSEERNLIYLNNYAFILVSL